MIKNWIIHVLTLLGAWIAWDNGVIQHMFANDVTWLSSAIIAMYAGLSVKLAYYDYLGTNSDHPVWDQMEFFSNLFLKIGMIGTVIGFLIVFGEAFENFDIDDRENVADIITAMAIGIATALWTTLIGLICSSLLDLQLENVTSEE